MSLFGSAGGDAAAQSAVKMKNFTGRIDITAGGVRPFTLSGTTSHLGKFTAYGEVLFVPGKQAGSLVGEGVVVFQAANGDLLVGVVVWEVAAGGNLRTSRIHFSWRDSVRFTNGTIVSNTGRFVTDRPPGLVVIAIISILSAILFPLFPWFNRKER